MRFFERVFEATILRLLDVSITADSQVVRFMAIITYYVLAFFLMMGTIKLLTWSFGDVGILLLFVPVFIGFVWMCWHQAAKKYVKKDEEETT